MSEEIVYRTNIFVKLGNMPLKIHTDTNRCGKFNGRMFFCVLIETSLPFESNMRMSQLIVFPLRGVHST